MGRACRTNLDQPGKLLVCDSADPGFSGCAPRLDSTLQDACPYLHWQNTCTAAVNLQLALQSAESGLLLPATSCP